MFPRLSIAKQLTATTDTVVLNLSWGTVVLGFTITKRPLIVDFEDELYPHQKSKSVVAITILVLVHFIIAYLLLSKRVEHPIKKGVEEGQLVYFDMKAKKLADKPKPAKTQPQKRPSAPRAVAVTPSPQPVVESIKSISPVAAPPEEDTMARIQRARERRRQLEDQAVAENNAAKGPSADDEAMARIKANIQAANYNRKGTSGIFTVLHKGVQTGSFAFRGWTNDPRDSTHQTYEVDAGVGGDVELAMVRKMIEIIREHYKGDFNWESERQGRVVPLSARPQDNAQLEAFLMREIFDEKGAR